MEALAHGGLVVVEKAGGSEVGLVVLEEVVRVVEDQVVNGNQFYFVLILFKDIYSHSDKLPNMIILLPEYRLRRVG